MIFSHKINIIILCFVSFAALAMEEQKETSQFFTKSLEPLLKARTVKKLAVFCERVVANTIKEEKNSTANLELIKNHNEYSLQRVLALLSEEKSPEFEKLYEGLRIGNVCYSGKNAAWSQVHYNHSYIHTLDVPRKKELTNCFSAGHYKSSSLKNLSIQPSQDSEDIVFLPNNRNDDKRYLHSAFHPDNLTLAWGCDNGQIVLKSLINNEWWRTTYTLHKSKILALKFAANGWLYSSNEEGKTYVWENVTNNQGWTKHQLPFTEPIISIVPSCDGSFVAFQHATSQNIEVIEWHSLIHKTLKISGELVAITSSNNILVSNNECLELFDLECRKIYSKELPLKKAQIIKNIAAVSQTTPYLVKGKEQKKAIRTYRFAGKFGDIFDLGRTEEVMVNKTDDSLYIPRKFSMEEVIEYLEENKK